MTITDWLKKQKELLAAATPGPWKHIPGDSYCAYSSVVCGDKTLVFEDHQGHDITANSRCCDDGYPADEAEARFIASVRTEHERALMIIEKYRKALEAVDELWFEDKPNVACSICDMGEAGYSSKGNGHHDDNCRILKCHETLDYFPEVGEE